MTRFIETVTKKGIVNRHVPLETNATTSGKVLKMIRNKHTYFGLNLSCQVNILIKDPRTRY